MRGKDAIGAEVVPQNNYLYRELLCIHMGSEFGKDVIFHFYLQLKKREKKERRKKRRGAETDSNHHHLPPITLHGMDHREEVNSGGDLPVPDLEKREEVGLVEDAEVADPPLDVATAAPISSTESRPTTQEDWMGSPEHAIDDM